MWLLSLNKKKFLNLNEQVYKGISIYLIKRNYDGYNAMRYLLGSKNSGQNIWIPKCYLEEDGTLKPNINIDFVFKKAFNQKKFMYAGININPYNWDWR